MLRERACVGMRKPPARPALEYEVRFLHFDRADVLRRARALGAAARAERTLLINVTYWAVREEDARMTVRLRQAVSRDDGVRATLTVKLPGGAAGFEEEHETAVSDSTQTAQILGMLGCRHRHTMVKFRDVVQVPGLGELALDSHPGLPPLLEVESPSLAKLQRLVRALGLAVPPPKDRLPSPSLLYAELYGVDAAKRDASGDLTFAHPSDLRRHITKNRAQFERVLAAQLKESNALMRRHRLLPPPASS